MKQPFSIQDPVGAGEINRARDLEATRNALAERRLCRRSVTGQTSATYRPDLAAGIRIFQRQVGLEPDGRLTPGGPTAHALAIGGAVSAGAPAGNKLLDAADCAALRDRVLTAADQFASISDDIQRLEKRLLERERELTQNIGELGQLARRLDLAINPSPRNLNAVSRELSNMPNDRDVQQAQSLVGDAQLKLRDIEDTEVDIAFTENQRDKAEQRFNQWIAQFERDCTAFV